MRLPPKPILTCLALSLGLGLGCLHPPAPPSASAEPSPSSRASLACSAAAPAPPALRRLSVEQYTNTLTDLVGDQPALRAVLEELQRLLNQLPRDGLRGSSFTGMDTRLGQRHLSTYVQVADLLGRAVAESAPALSALATECALGPALDRACMLGFLRTFGRHAFRRPLSEAELETAMAVSARAETGREAYRSVLAWLLASPAFWLRGHAADTAAATPEMGASAEAFGLATRLSHHFWQSSPDERLLSAAASGELSRGDGYRAQVDRLSRHQRGRATWYAFVRQWLELDAFGGFATGPALDRLADGMKISQALYDDAVWEVEELVGHYTFDAPGSYRDLLTSDLILTRSARLAAVYGIAPWDGHSPPAAFPEGQRSGLLTRAALLISANHATQPFERGAFVRRQLLCEPIEPPAQRPPDAFVLPAFDPEVSTRERHERKVSSVACKSCHELFSPYGYVLEAYDALGRFRHEERLIDDAGMEVGRLPLDTRARVLQGPDEARVVTGPVALSLALAESPNVQRCLARQYFRFTFQRRETRADACTVEEMSNLLAQGGLASLHRDVAFTPAFTQGAVAP